jgi:hypothetical protein
VSCCGRNSTSGESIFLYIVFNESSTMIQELKPGADLSLSKVEGTCAFSYPCVISDNEEFNLDTKRKFYERAATCYLGSNGSLLFFSEKISPSAIACSIKSLRSLKKLNDEMIKKECRNTKSDNGFLSLLAFEQLTNITETSEFVFGGDGLGR